MQKAIYLALLVAIAPPLDAQTGVRSALIAADAELSSATFKNGIAATLPAALGTDGVLVWPGAGVVVGPEMQVQFFRRQVLLSDAKFSWQPFRIEIARDSSLALVTGVAVVDRLATDPFPAIHRIGRYLAAWRRVDGAWHLSALCFVNLIASAETMWTEGIGPVEQPMLRSAGPAAAFIAADSAFAADAGVHGVAKGFMNWAAPDATIFSGTGEVNTGPEQIGAIFAGNTSHWAWGAVAAGSSADGMLGWTVGQATITAPTGGSQGKSKYLTFWRKMPDGTIKFIADGGNARP